MFGFPTGLGALLVRRDALSPLIERKRYFGGGSVAMHLVKDFNVCRFKQGEAPEEALEDGTLPFQQVIKDNNYQLINFFFNVHKL